MPESGRHGLVAQPVERRLGKAKASRLSVHYAPLNTGLRCRICLVEFDLQTGHWLAGLLEGEATFLKGPPSSPAYPIVRLLMTDADVVERVAAIFGRRTNVHPPRQSHHKMAYSATIKGGKAVSLMQQIRPLMGARRQAAIDVAIQASAVAREQGRYLTHSAAEQILAERSGGAHAMDVAARHGVSKSLVYKLTQGTRNPRIQAAAAGIEWRDEFATDWLAGLLEGEGHFGSRIQNGWVRLRVAVSMTDRDVVERAAKLMGVERLSTNDPLTPGWSRTYAAYLGGNEKALDLMERLLPKMGERRSRRITEAAAVYRDQQAARPHVHGGILSEFDVRAIRSSASSTRELAMKYGIAERTVRSVRQRASWAWLA